MRSPQPTCMWKELDSRCPTLWCGVGALNQVAQQAPGSVDSWACHWTSLFVVASWMQHQQWCHWQVLSRCRSGAVMEFQGSGMHGCIDQMPPQLLFFPEKGTWYLDQWSMYMCNGQSNCTGRLCHVLKSVGSICWSNKRTVHLKVLSIKNFSPLSSMPKIKHTKCFYTCWILPVGQLTKFKHTRLKHEWKI